MPDVPGIQAIAGPLLFAILFNWGFLGILTTQVYIYYLSFPTDRIVLKMTVFAIFFLETLQTILITRTEFRMFAIGFANPGILDQVDIVWFSVPMLCGIVALISQCFYAYRLLVITQSKILTGIIVLLSFVQLGGAIALGVQNKDAGLFSRLFSSNSKGSFQTTTVWESCSASCDVLIAAFMSYHLRKQDTAIKQTRDLVSRIIRLSIQTGTFTATVALAVLVLVYLPGHPTYYQACVAVLGKAYSNSMLVSLNSRIRVYSASAPTWNEDTSKVSANRRYGVSSLHFTNPPMFSRESKNVNGVTTEEVGLDTQVHTNTNMFIY